MPDRRYRVVRTLSLPSRFQLCVPAFAPYDGGPCFLYERPTPGGGGSTEAFVWRAVRSVGRLQPFGLLDVNSGKMLVYARVWGSHLRSFVASLLASWRRRLLGSLYSLPKSFLLGKTKAVMKHVLSKHRLPSRSFLLPGVTEVAIWAKRIQQLRFELLEKPRAPGFLPFGRVEVSCTKFILLGDSRSNGGVERVCSPRIQADLNHPHPLNLAALWTSIGAAFSGRRKFLALARDPFLCPDAGFLRFDVLGVLALLGLFLRAIYLEKGN